MGLPSIEEEGVDSASMVISPSRDSFSSDMTVMPSAPPNYENYDDRAMLFLDTAPKRGTFLRKFRPFVLYGLAVFGIITLGIELSASTWSKPLSCNCGTSVAEAMSMGCKYDLLASAWLPGHCRDDELSAQFDAASSKGSWDYYSDRNGSRSLNLTEVGLLADHPEERYWTTREWHIVHCVFYWHKLHRSRNTGVQIEGRYDASGHIKHCGMVFLAGRTDLQDIFTLQGASLTSD